MNATTKEDIRTSSQDAPENNSAQPQDAHASAYRDLMNKFEALGRSQGIIEFELDGTIITANDNFLALIEYSLEEIRGAHHSKLVDPGYARSREYEEFWRTLRSGRYHEGMFPRVNKRGETFWISATYTRFWMTAAHHTKSSNWPSMPPKCVRPREQHTPAAGHRQRRDQFAVLRREP